MYHNIDILGCWILGWITAALIVSFGFGAIISVIRNHNEKVNRKSDPYPFEMPFNVRDIRRK